MSAWLERVRAALAPKGYAVEGELATGGMGTVFLARQRTLDWLVAVKIIRPELYTANAAERFRVEARILASFSHPNIVPVHDADTADGLPYYVMEYLSGDTLARRLRRGPLPHPEALKVGRDLLDALEAAHRRAVVHRDVKPANLFLLPGRAVLIDFGVAKRLARAATPSGSGGGATVGSAGGLSVPGTLIGTVDYMPPEQRAGLDVTTRTDLYAAAMVIYEAYTRRHWEIVEFPERADWSGVPRQVARVLRHALAFAPEARFGDAASFRRALWRTRAWTYQRRTIGLTLAGVVVGSLGAAWLIGRWQNGLPPFPPPGSLRLVVAPLLETCAADPRIADRVAGGLVRDLQGFPDFSVRGPTRPPWLKSRSTALVRGTACARGDTVRVELEALAGATGRDPRVIVARGDTGRPDLVADSLAYGVVRELWDRENPLDPILPLRALPRTSAGLSAWLEAERLFAQARWGDADRAYENAEALDSTCWLCAWRHAEVDQWFGRPPDPIRTARYWSHIDSFPPQYQSLMRAARQGLPQRLETLARATHQRGSLLLGFFMKADELYHRGPLVGHGREEAVEAFRRVVHVRPDFMPAWEHLTWVLTAQGDEVAAQAAYDTLQASGPPRDPFSQELRLLLAIGLRCRFDGAAACGLAWQGGLAQAGAAGYPDLAAGPRYLMTFDAPRAAVELGRRFATLSEQPTLAQSGLVGAVSGYLALGLVDSARAAARALEQRFPAAWADVFPAELDGALLLLDGAAADGRLGWHDVRRALADQLRSRHSTAATRRRAAWMLLLLGRRFPGLDAAGDLAQALRVEPPPRALAQLLDADARARMGHVDDALAATDALTALQADSLGDPERVDPFFRTVLHLFRATWYERHGDDANAHAELVWYQNNDAVGRPDGPPQVADIDWGFGTFARWRLARLLDRRGDATACRAYRSVAAAWSQGDPPYRSRADSAARRAAVLGCEEMR
jgi:predicted Ser/Thr protein kinase